MHNTIIEIGFGGLFNQKEIETITYMRHKATGAEFSPPFGKTAHDEFLLSCPVRLF